VNKNPESSIKDVLKELVDSKKLKTGYRQKSLNVFWKEKMGDVINGYTEKISLRRGVLYVSISSSPLKQELDIGKDKILKLIEEEFGTDYITSIVFR